MILSEKNSNDSPWVGKNGPLLIAEIGGNQEGESCEDGLEQQVRRES